MIKIEGNFKNSKREKKVREKYPADGQRITLRGFMIRKRRCHISGVGGLPA